MQPGWQACPSTVVLQLILSGALKVLRTQEYSGSVNSNPKYPKASLWVQILNKTPLQTCVHAKKRMHHPPKVLYKEITVPTPLSVKPNLSIKTHAYWS